MARRPSRREFFSMAVAAGLGALLASALARAQTSSPSYALYPDPATGRLKIKAPKGVDIVLDQSTFGAAPATYDALVRQDSSGNYVAYDRSGNVICKNSPTACIQEAIGQYKTVHVSGSINMKNNIVNINFNRTAGFSIVGNRYTYIQDGGFSISNPLYGHISGLNMYNSSGTLTGIKLLNSDNVYIDDVIISGYNTAIHIDTSNAGLDNIINRAVITRNNIGLWITGTFSPAVKVMTSRITDNKTNILIGGSMPAPWNIKFIACDIEAGGVTIDARAQYRDIRDVSFISSYIEAVTFDIYANPYIGISIIDSYLEPGSSQTINVHSGIVVLNLFNSLGNITVNVDSDATLIIHVFDWGYYSNLGIQYHGTKIVRGTINGTLQIIPVGTLPYVTSLPTTGAYIGQSVLYFDGTNYYIAVWNGSAWKKVALN
jgi:hypothetical protein